MKNKFVSIIIMAVLALQVVACGASDTAKAGALEFESIAETREDDGQGADLQEPVAVTESEAESTNTEPEANEEANAEDDSQIQRYDFEGQYYAGRGNLSITQEADGSFLIEVWWGSSASEHSEWVMTGTYDEGANRITYSDCVKHDYTLKENGEVDTDVTAYTDGTGNIQIVDGSTIVWTDDQDHIADDVELTR
nr:hypothetical protein [uncultured Butyrivibrio sp.]